MVFFQLFTTLDKDNSGFLDFKEMRNGFLALGLQLSEKEAQKEFDLMDKDKVNTLSL